MSWPLPVICPPKVKSLIVRVPVEFWMVVALRVAVSKAPDTEAWSKVKLKAPPLREVSLSRLKESLRSSKLIRSLALIEPLIVRADMEAVVISKVLVNWLEALVNDQPPVTISFCDKEAGPLVQSKDTVAWAPDTAISNPDDLNDRDETVAKLLPDDSLIERLAPAPPLSVEQSQSLSAVFFNI